MSHVIEVKHLDKVYKIDKREKFLTIIKQMFTNDKYIKKKVLSDINFDIEEGERVALLGKNGSGKSTILKIITGVSHQTEGEVIVNGKVNALLELNSGFEMDFTGRENIYLKGTLMGLSKEEIKKIEKKVIDFADIGEYIDYPIRKYSTGMRARLGFSIAISIDPEILIIDEALSVGDEEFKNKCLKKIEEITSKKKVTMLLVTHSSEMARQFCSRGIVLENGKIIYDGAIDDSVEFYRKTLKGVKDKI